MKLRIELHDDQGKTLYFIASGEGDEYKTYGVAVSEKAAKKLRAKIRKEMSANTFN